MSKKLLPLPDVSEMLSVPYSRLRSAVREWRVGALRSENGVLCIPEDFLSFQDGSWTLVDGLSGTLTVLQDAGMDLVQATTWLLEGDDTFVGRPIDALKQGRKKQVNSYARSLAF